MGKKRNNAAKKKQVSKKKISSTYGVSVLKGGTIARNNGVIEAKNPMDVKAAAKKQSGQKSNDAILDNHNDTKGKHKQSPCSRNENEEFQRLHASLEERSLMQQAQKTHQRKNKNQKAKNGWGSFARPSSTMAPATLTLEPKTTQQLVDDAANQVAQMSEIGQRLPQTNSVAPGQSSLSAAAGTSWSALKEAEVQQPESRVNAFAALDDSDSDNEWADAKPAKVPQFQFQPASFSFQSNFVTVGPSEDDIDPDL